MQKLLFALLLACALPAPVFADDARPTSTQLQEFVGQYVLPDGRVLTITQRQHRLVAQLEGQVAVALAPTGPARYDAMDGTLRLAFDQRSNGNVAKVDVIIGDGVVRQAALQQR